MQNAKQIKMRIAKTVLVFALVVANALLFHSAFLGSAKTFAQGDCNKHCGTSLFGGGTVGHRTCSGAGEDSCHVTDCGIHIVDCGYEDNHNDVCAGNPGGTCNDPMLHNCY